MDEIDMTDDIDDDGMFDAEEQAFQSCMLGRLQQGDCVFQSAKAKLVDDLTRAGESVDPAFLESAAGGLNGGDESASNHLANRPLSRRLPPPAPAAQPPAAAKRVAGAAQTGPPALEGALSARALGVLGLEAGEALPEALARLDGHLVETICSEVLVRGEEVTWEDIAGQEAAKALIQEVVVWPMLNPAIFQGARAPPRGVLLFGPPGTGKTLLGRAVASNIRAAFFSISASSLTSKWIGESEKLVRTLFAVAAWLAPSVIFVDEIDSILSARSEDEHESYRRVKTEMLVQMEGCGKGVEGEMEGKQSGAAAAAHLEAPRRVLLMGATNRPEDLDEAARRRLPKQLYIPLPCAAARRAMLSRALRFGWEEQGPTSRPHRARVPCGLSPGELERVVLKTRGYSGSDMRALVQEACQGPVRDAVRAAGLDGLAALTPAQLREVGLRDFAGAARAQRASVLPEEVRRYEAYDARHGARSAFEDGGELDEGWGL